MTEDRNAINKCLMFKSLEENIRENLYDLGIGKDFIKQKSTNYKVKDKFEY